MANLTQRRRWVAIAASWYETSRDLPTRLRENALRRAGSEDWLERRRWSGRPSCLADVVRNGLQGRCGQGRCCAPSSSEISHNHRSRAVRPTRRTTTTTAVSGRFSWHHRTSSSGGATRLRVCYPGLSGDCQACGRCQRSVGLRPISDNVAYAEIERRMAEHPPRGCSFVSCNWRSKTRNSSALKATEIRDFLLALMAEANAELKSLLA